MPRLRKDFALAALKHAILNGGLPHGSALKEEAIAKQLGVSRTPVREALRELEAVGLVVTRGRRGFEVRGFTQEELARLNEARIRFEAVAIALACERASDRDMANVEQLLHEMSKRGQMTDIAYRQLHMRFHRTLYGASRNPFIMRAIDPLLDLADLAFEAIVPDEERYNLARTGHKEIAEALRTRDKDRAVNALRSHILSAQARMIKALQERERKGVASRLDVVADALRTEWGSNG